MEMKAVLSAGLLFLVIVQAEGHAIRTKRAILEPEARECIEQLKLDKEEIQGIQNLTYAPDDHANYTQFMDCYWKKIGYLNQNGALEHEYVTQMIAELLQENFDPDMSRSIAVLVVSKCRDIEGGSHGQKATRIGNCVMKNLKRIITVLLA